MSESIFDSIKTGDEYEIHIIILRALILLNMRVLAAILIPSIMMNLLPKCQETKQFLEKVC